MATEYKELRPAFPVTAILIGGLSVAAGLIAGQPLITAAGGLIGLILFFPMIRTSASYRPFFVHWRSLAEPARDRMRDRHRTITRRQLGARLLALAALALTATSFTLAVRQEIIRGADLTDPGDLFMTYNRLAAPDLAELIELYVERDLPLDQTSGADLRILRNLYFAVEGYNFSEEDLRDLFDRLLWYRPYRAFPNDINALPPEYRDRVARIIAVEESR